MKYCPQCNRQYPDAWITFCTDDGELLREELSPPGDPNWDPRVRGPQTDAASEQPTQWLPYNPPRPPAAGGWMAPDERAPMADRPWQIPPASPRPNVQRPPPGLAVASFVAGIVGLMFGWFCMLPVPGLVALLLGLVALGQMRSSPNPAGRGLAIAGVIMGGINLAFILLWILWFILSMVFGS